VLDKEFLVEPALVGEVSGYGGRKIRRAGTKGISPINEGAAILRVGDKLAEVEKAPNLVEGGARMLRWVAEVLGVVEHPVLLRKEMAEWLIIARSIRNAIA
jgi:hypothetical protein